MKTKEELNTIKKEVENINKKLAELNEDELKEVTGGIIYGLSGSGMDIDELVKEKVGGVCGKNDGVIENCYNTGKITGVEYVGGLVGEVSGAVGNGQTSDLVYAGGVAGINNTIKR